MIKSLYFWFVVFGLVLSSVNFSWGFLEPVAKLSFQVVDEQGKPVENALVSVGFMQPRDARKGLYEELEKAFTDAKGYCEVSHQTIGEVAFSVNKDGYYKSSGRYDFMEKELMRWQPWNQLIQVVLRKIENPVPMYARDTQNSRKVKMPVTADLEKGVGFDLIAYDWVAPYGKGVYSDFYFRMTSKYYKEHPQYKGQYEYDSELTITFTNKYDGIQVVKDSRKGGSVFKLPRFAPEDGYIKSWTATKMLSYSEPSKSSFKEDNNYFFRIRSEERDGKFYRAMYGKIQGEIEYGPKSPNSAVIIFKYYLNPDYTRNMEYDPKRNLFGELPGLERVTRP